MPEIPTPNGGFLGPLCEQEFLKLQRFMLADQGHSLLCT